MVTQITYTERDFNSIKQAIINRLRNRFPNDWPEIINSSIGGSIVDVVAWAHSQRSFYFDMQAQNSYLQTATLPAAILAIARQLGYTRRLASSASVSVTLFPQPPQPVPITIRQGTQIQVGNLFFEAIEDVVIPAGKPVWPDESTSDIVVFNEGETREEEFTSDGSPNQSFTLSQSSVVRDSITVEIQGEDWEETSSLVVIEGRGIGEDLFIGTGQDDQSYQLTKLHAIIDIISPQNLSVVVGLDIWQRVVNFTGAPNEYRVEQDSEGVTTVFFGLNADGAAPPNSIAIVVLYQITGPQKRFTATFNEDSQATLRFGDDDAGLIPPDGAIITATYRVGGGVLGNIRRGQMDGVIRGFLPSGAAINVRLFNQENGSGGEAEESLESVKFFAPLVAKSNNRAVTAQDFSVLATTFVSPNFGSPAFASAKLKQQIPELNLVQVATWSRDAQGRLAAPTSPLKQGLANFLASVSEITTHVEIIDGKIIFFDIDAVVELQTGRALSSALQSATSALLQHFNSTFVLPGIDLSISRITQEVREVPQVVQATIERVQGSEKEVIDFGAGDDVTTNFTGFFLNPPGQKLVPGSFEITDGTQTISDDGSGNLSGDVDVTGVNTIDYDTGGFDATFAAPPTATSFVSAEARIFTFFANEEFRDLTVNSIDDQTIFFPIVERPPIGLASGNSVDSVLPDFFLPYTPRRVVFIGGFDNGGLQPGGQLLAFDDGVGNIIGDVVPGGTVNYSNGQVAFTWNATPPPITTTNLFGRLIQIPDGNILEFDFEVRDTTGGGGSIVDLATLLALGRIEFTTSDLSSVNVVLADAFDNGFGSIYSESLSDRQPSTIDYASGLGKLIFTVAPETGVGQDFGVRITPKTLFLYAAFAAYVPGTSEVYDKVIFADNTGRILRDSSQAFPFAELDHSCGRIESGFTAPSVAGRRLFITYDSLVFSTSRNIPIDELTMPTLGIVTLKEGTT